MKQLLFICAMLLITIPTTLAQTTRETLFHDDIERNYRVFVPEHYDIDTGGHLILVLHGGGMDNLLMRQVTNQQIENRVNAEEINAIVVYPNGFGNAWNDGRIREGQASIREHIDDVGLLLSLVDTLAQEYNIDPTALYIAGFSNGGGMAYRLACEASDRITAIAPVASLMADNMPCEPNAPVAVLSIVGDEDPILPLSGGDINYWDMSLGTVRSLDNTLNIWTIINECEGFNTPLELEDLAEDNTTVSVSTGIDCIIPTTSVLIHGGGHTWAGTSYIVSAEEYGRTSQDIDAGVMIVDFFKSAGLN